MLPLFVPALMNFHIQPKKKKKRKRKKKELRNILQQTH